MPRFSIIIPTRQRPDTLRHSLQTAVEQTYRDVEIIVHECGDDPQTARIVEETAGGRTRHLKTVSQVSMAENWERALASAAGDYLTIIGDDDGLLGDACAVAACILEDHPVELLTWRPATYFWPASTFEQGRNRLQANLREISSVELQSPRTLLELVYRFQVHHYMLPMVLHSFVSRKLVERVRDELGRYFQSAAPDIASGVVNGLFGESCILSHRPLSISGLSHHSTGSKLHLSGDAALRQEAERAAFEGIQFHPTLADSRNSQLFAANELMTVKERVFPTEEPEFNLRNMIRRALESLGSGLEDYSTGLDDIRRTAALNGLSLEDFTIPAPSRHARTPAQGLTALGADSVAVDIDGNRVGLANVSDASRLLGAILPPFRPPRDLLEPVAIATTISEAAPPVSFDFSNGGNGVLLLGPGWSEAEEWGVWTIGTEADIEWRIKGGLHRELRMTMLGRMFVHEKLPQATGSVYSNGRRVAGFQARFGEPGVTLEFALPPRDSPNGRISIQIRVDQPRSPASLGISNDSRRLGFGLETITVA